MAETKKVPNLRFKGFTDDWEQRKLGDFGKVQMNKRIFKNQTSESGDVPFYKIGTFGKNPDAYISEKLYTEYKNKYPYPKKGDLLISASGSIGRIVEYQGQKAYYQDSNIVWLDHNNEVLNLFLKAFYQIVKWDGTEGSTIKRLYNKNILHTKIKLPSLPEQKKVGQIIDTVSHLIDLQQRKLNKLNRLRNSLLQKLFADDNSLNPELRFKEFHTNWDMKKIGSLFTERKDKSADGQLLSVSITKGVYPFDPTERKNNSSTNKSNYKLVKKGDIAYNSMRMWQGAEGVSNYTGIVSPAYTVLRPQDGINSEFFAYMFKRADMLNKFKRYSQGLTSDTWNLKFPIIRTINVKSTTTDEQEKIVKLFKAVESTMNLQTKKLERYQQIKKFLLQQMFI